MPSIVGTTAEEPVKAGEPVVGAIDVVLDTTEAVEVTLVLAVPAVPNADVQIEALDEPAELR